MLSFRPNTMKSILSAQYLKPQTPDIPRLKFEFQPKIMHESDLFGVAHLASPNFFLTDGTKIIGYVTTTGIKTDLTYLY